MIVIAALVAVLAFWTPGPEVLANEHALSFILLWIPVGAADVGVLLLQRRMASPSVPRWCQRSVATIWSDLRIVAPTLLAVTVFKMWEGMPWVMLWVVFLWSYSTLGLLSSLWVWLGVRLPKRA